MVKLYVRRIFEIDRQMNRGLGFLSFAMVLIIRVSREKACVKIVTVSCVLKSILIYHPSNNG